MEYKSFYLIPLDESSASFIELHPDYNSFREDLVEPIRQNVTLAGELNSYRIEGYHWNYSIPLTNVSSEEVGKISTWWEQQRRLYLTFNNSEAQTTLIQVRITNFNNPFPTKTDRTWNNYDGFLQLKSNQGIDKAIYTGLPFILDDPLWGLLDQNYNFLT